MDAGVFAFGGAVADRDALDGVCRPCTGICEGWRRETHAQGHETAFGLHVCCSCRWAPVITSTWARLSGDSSRRMSMKPMRMKRAARRMSRGAGLERTEPSNPAQIGRAHV